MEVYSGKVGEAAMRVHSHVCEFIRMLTTETKDHRFDVSNTFTTLIYYRKYFVIKIDIFILISFSYIARVHAGVTRATATPTRNCGGTGGNFDERNNRRQGFV